MPGMGMRQVFSSDPPIVDPHAGLPPREPVYRSLPVVGDDFEESGPMKAIFQEAPRVIPRPLPPFYEKNTSFSCDRSAGDIFQALMSALAAYSIMPKPEKAKLKGSGVVMGEAVSFHVNIFTKPNGNGHLVEFQRRSGGSCGFWHLFRDAMEALSSDLADAAAFVESIEPSNLEVFRKIWKQELKPKAFSIEEMTRTLSKRLIIDMAKKNATKSKSQENFKEVVNTSVFCGI